MLCLRTLLATLALLAVSGCAVDYMTQLRKEKATQAAASLQNGAYFEAFETAKQYLGDTVFDRSAFIEVFKKAPGFPAGFRSGLKGLISNMHSEVDLAIIERDIVIVADTALLTPAEVEEQRAELATSLKTAVAAGTFKTTFGRITEQYPAILEGEGLVRVMDMSVADILNAGPIGNTGRRKYVTALFDAARTNPAAAPYRAKLESQLPGMRLTLDELRQDAAPVFPALAASVIANRFKPVTITSAPQNRLLEIDVGARLTRNAEIEVVSNEAKPKFAIVLSELEYREQHSDLPYARGVVERSQQVNWAYEITVKGPAAARSTIVRDSENTTSRECVNPASASTYCTSGTGLTWFADVRERTLNRIAAAVTDLLGEVQ
jgi:hypothetical protein